MGLVVVHNTVSVPHLMLVILCNAYPEQFSLAVLFLEGLDRLSGLRGGSLYMGVNGLYTLLVLREEGECRPVSRRQECLF